MRTRILKTIVLAALLIAQPIVHCTRADEVSPRLRPYQARVDRAVESALLFLARAERASNRKEALFEDWNGETNAVAGLAGMAFLAKGHRPGAGPYGENINRTIDFILSSPTENGYLGIRGGKMYEHGIATLYLSEISGMVDPERQAKIDAMLPRALKIILDAQKVAKTDAADNGGWRYEPTSNDADLSVTGWNLMALRSARLGGAPVPDQAIADAVGFIERCQHPNGGYRYVPRNDWFYQRRGYWVHINPTTACTAAGILSRELSGKHGDEMNIKNAEWLAKQMVPNDLFPPDHHEYCTYYASQAFFQLGGEHWENFAEPMYKHLLSRQQSNGSWAHASQGSVYPTAMYALALSVTYRQLPIYQR